MTTRGPSGQAFSGCSTGSRTTPRCGPGTTTGCVPSSTIGLERATNPFLRCADVAAFLALKRDWPTVKQQLGLK